MRKGKFGSMGGKGPTCQVCASQGETSVSKLKGASKSMYESMSEKQLDEFASTKRKGKPEHVSKKNSDAYA